ncbi:MAG: Thrombospondin, type 1 repeat protein [Labilithrix sp.]|nr:Thrombospondin, type 1 repeat protein [Labilithrix sp.]
MSMTKTWTTLLAAAMTCGLVHCAAPADQGAAQGESESASASSPVDEAAIENVASESQAISTHCWAQIERPIPGDLVLKLGQTITLKTGGAKCPVGVTEKVAYRYYVEKVDNNGKILAPRVSPQGPTEWSLTKSTFDTSLLPGPGRYRIYGFSIPVAFIPAWQANNVAARAMPVRTGNAYTTFVTTSWSAGTYSECSATCGGGTQTRAVACKDQGGVAREDSWCSGLKPEAIASCNEQPCDVCNGDPCCIDPIMCMDPCMMNPMMCDPCMMDPMLCDPCFGDPLCGAPPCPPECMADPGSPMCVGNPWCP